MKIHNEKLLKAFRRKFKTAPVVEIEVDGDRGWATYVIDDMECEFDMGQDELKWVSDYTFKHWEVIP